MHRDFRDVTKLKDRRAPETSEDKNVTGSTVRTTASGRSVSFGEFEELTDDSISFPHSTFLSQITIR
ncbi:hypothetical protein DPEC_G00173220 [Dallia pectoralis]|uniref:Uncharacterized protein n=1 Tax=Dallia pectoralis TaxID=75939 RepID=A0ACC2GDZ7_DALPE|nr:hypothetical protein DPEC_G00173220 [Dallia pectoralis]